MIIINKVVLLGRLTKDPELRYTAGNGTAVCKFTLAVNRQFKKDEADFISCVSFGKSAETISQYLLKGSQIAIGGRIQTGSYDAQDGTKRYTTDVVVESFEFVGGGKGNSSNSDGFGSTNFDDDITPVNDEDMPFN